MGSIIDPDGYSFPDNALSSLRPLPTPTENTILLFKDRGYRGKMVVLNGADADLNNVGMNDNISSIIVLSGTWEVYQDSNFVRPLAILRAGYYPNASHFSEDNISSLKPV